MTAVLKRGADATAPFHTANWQPNRVNPALNSPGALAMANVVQFPVFARGIKRVDSKGRGVILDYNIPIVCAGVRVNPGDLVFADFDGIVAVGAEFLPQVIQMATETVEKENGSRSELTASEYLGIFATNTACTRSQNHAITT